jgi:uncharacterized membrane protein YfcA
MMMTTQALLALASGGMVGMLLGATGAGGSLVAIPLFVYVVGVPVQSATAMSLVVVGFSALFGAWKESRYQKVRGTAALVFGGTGMIGAWVGAQGHQFIQGDMVLFLFGILMIGVSVATWKRSKKNVEAGENQGCSRELSIPCLAKALSMGLGIGVLTGFFGVGGGFLIVPALIIVMGFPMPIAIGTSLLIIAINAGSGILSHLNHISLDRMLTLWVISGSIIGMVVGGYIGRELGSQRVTKAFSVIAGVIGVCVVIDKSLEMFG